MRSTRRAFLALCTTGVVSGVAGCHRRRGAALTFQGSVDAEIRARFRRAARRTLEIVPAELDGRVRIAFATPRDDSGVDASGRFDRAVWRAMHVADAIRSSDPLAWRRFRATYDRGSRTIRFVDPNSSAFRSALQAVTDGGHGGAVDWYPPEPMLAHELTHALQYDRVDDVPPADDSYDAARARRAVTEGTADYVAGRYRAACRADGEQCTTVPVSLDGFDADPAVVATVRQSYVNGRAFVARLARDGGWDRIWDVHESPPPTTADTTFPARYVAGPTDPTSVRQPTLDRDWIRVRADRLGVVALYGKLFALGVASLEDEAARLPSRTTEATTYRLAYRTPLLEGWQGDQFAVYGHVDDPDRIGHVWRVRLATATGAERLATAVRGVYDRRGTSRSVGWVLDGRPVGVERTGAAVTFWSAPDQAAVDPFRRA